MTDTLEDITFEEVGGLVDPETEIEDLAADDPELSAEVEDGRYGNDLVDADSESDVPPDTADKTLLVTIPDPV
jgi:hypothetical protein